MTIEAKIIEDSISPAGKRLTTFVLKYPRFIHSEFMTHRVFSRNASSSRAIPFEKQIEMIQQDVAEPISFKENKKGMQAGGDFDEEKQAKAVALWRKAGLDAIESAKKLNELGAHKQYVNRLIEPYSHISVVVTSSEYSNFFALRYHSMAQPEIAELAKQMWEEYVTKTPKAIDYDQWHLPFVTNEERGSAATQEDWNRLIVMSVARCARVSYMNHDGTSSSYEKDLVLYNRLLGSQPIHASPAEHQATPIFDPVAASGNFFGWKQYRKTLKNENVSTFGGPLG